MNEPTDLLHYALAAYDMNADSVAVESVMPRNFHGDAHYKIRIGELAYSARFISGSRYEHDVFLPLTDAVLTEQMRFISFLNGHGIPFMRPVPTVSGEDYHKLVWNGAEYRFFLFEWIEGRHITRCTDSVAYKIGALVRRLHALAANYECALPKISHREGSLTFLSMLEEAASAAPAECRKLLHPYIADAQRHIGQAHRSTREYRMQSDLNPLNILWDDKEQCIGIVDFEHIGYTERIEGLAWLIKWYSRTAGLFSHHVSPALAQSLLDGYRASDDLKPADWERLPSLIWLTGCLNWGFVDKTRRIVKQSISASQMKTELDAHLTKYTERGAKLGALLTL
ncbi:Stress response kinase A [Paenibacillus solanacearum]|uniref:Stress response kinase A n=1 Tax=Paenibacillus solanacearum TaxID=2048548 RepID=A0A916JRP1_9BACL|nr:phosphotransferase [Paenibacillus solanacearum]CAG7597191.1 Stress response kinase A [Paenibacillus solanacearum]